MKVSRESGARRGYLREKTDEAVCDGRLEPGKKTAGKNGGALRKRRGKKRVI